MSDISDNRPDPDKLLKALSKTEEKLQKGKLKIFFGMCAGAGKTYSMLQAAHKAKADSLDIVIGVVETHKRIETEELLAGLERIPLREILYRNTNFKEMDLDEILSRKPQIVLVDELAHTNIPGSRHSKRYQDVLELLEHGVDVYTTLNVQHIESRSEIVQQITGAQVRETVPDSIIERANEIELIDITPEDLLKRLSEGKVYTPEKSTQAIKNFFRKGNLTALREMALRLTAERVDYQLRDYKESNFIDTTWKSGQRLMVAIGPSPHSAELIRWTRRLAYAMEAKWIAVYVETDAGFSDKDKENLNKNITLAKELGAEIISTHDDDIAKALIRAAKENNITQIVIGKTRGKRLFSGKDLTQRILKESGQIDIFSVGGEERAHKLFSFSFFNTSGLAHYALAVLAVISTAVLLFFFKNEIGYQAVSLILLFLISVMPLFNIGRGPIILSAVVSALIWNFFFIPPLFTLHIGKVEDALMLAIFFIVSVVSGILTNRLKSKEKLLRVREERTNALYLLSRELSAAAGFGDLTEIIVRNFQNNFNINVAVFFSSKDKMLSPTPHPLSVCTLDESEWFMADWSFKNRQKAGRFTNTLSQSRFQFIPLVGSRFTLGVVCLKVDSHEPFSFERQTRLHAFISQITTAVEREYLQEFNIDLRIHSESEKFYNTLFNSISHELKTPVTAIYAATSTLEQTTGGENRNHSELIHEIKLSALRLNRLIVNLLDMTRLESDRLPLKLAWNDIQDLFSGLKNRLKEEPATHKVEFSIENDIPVFKFDLVLLEQALMNIIHNALIYTPEKTVVRVSAKKEDGICILRVSDNGKGIPEEALVNLFKKFYRLPGTKTGGTGLGLSIAKGFIEAHDGSIMAQNNSDGGASFIIKIPIKKSPAYEY